MTSCFDEPLFEIKDGDFGANMTGLYNHECYKGFLKGELNFKIHVSFYRVNNINILAGVKALAVRVKPVNIPICQLARLS